MHRVVPIDQEYPDGNEPKGCLVDLATGREYYFPQTRGEHQLVLCDSTTGQPLESVRQKVLDCVFQGISEGYLPENPTLSQVIEVCLNACATACEVAMEQMPHGFTSQQALRCMREHFLT